MMTKARDFAVLKRLAWLAPLGALFVASGASAQEATAAVNFTQGGVPKETAFVFNTLLFLFSGALVMWMAAGFCMLEAGFVRQKNVGTQCVKNIGAYSLAAIFFGILGYHLMYPDGNWTVNGLIGSFESISFAGPGADATAESGNYAKGSDFFYQMAFCATAASIVSGTIAERVKLCSFFVFTVILTSIIYPIVGSWQWGGGFLSGYGFSDFAGSTIVHSVGGWAGLAGALVIGARRGRYTPDGRPVAMPGSSLPLAALGTFILWFGWLGFNGGSQLALGSLSDAADIGRIFVNTNTAAAGGALGAFLTTYAAFKKVDLTMVLNGALGGLVMITAEPLHPTFGMALLLGLVGGGAVTASVLVLDKLKIDDTVGAVPVHLVCGILGTLAVPLSNTEVSFGAQVYGVVAVGAFTFFASYIVWQAIKMLMGVRISSEAEETGLDLFSAGPQAA